MIAESKDTARPERHWRRPGLYEAGGLVLGLVFGGAFIAAGHTGIGVFAILLLVAFSAYTQRGRSDVAVAGTDRADERQVRLNLEALHLAYLAIIVVAIVGAIVEIANGHFGPYAIICSVGGGTQIIATAALSRRR